MTITYNTYTYAPEKVAGLLRIDHDTATTIVETVSRAALHANPINTEVVGRHIKHALPDRLRPDAADVVADVLAILKY